MASQPGRRGKRVAASGSTRPVKQAIAPTVEGIWGNWLNPGPRVAAMAGVTAWLAFVAGAGAFFTPCVLPIVPAFLGFVSGGAQATVRVRFARTAAFVLGFGVAFTALGFLIATAGQGAQSVLAQAWLRRIGGGLVILFGLAMVGLLRPAWMDRDFRFHGRMPAWLGPSGTALALGAAFGIGWSPCVGPILAAILIQAGLGGSGAQGAFLLAVFSLGLAVPFLAFGVLADRGAAILRRSGRVAQAVEVAGGVLLILLGIVIFTGTANRILYLIR